MQTPPKGRIFDIERYSIHDGPGIRTTVFFLGCPLSCWWCHNPESQGTEPFVHYRREDCLLCSSCVEACEHEALSVGSNGIVRSAQRCHNCGACAEACPTLGRERVGREISVAELLDEIEKDRAFYETSGGGVTFSGGEPLLQDEFLYEVLSACAQRGLHRAVDTSGVARRSVILRIAELVDLFLYDLKMMDAALHRETTGVSNRIVLDNLRALVALGANVRVRVPLIPGVNDSPSNLDQTARFLIDLGGIREVSLLPFHLLAREKHEKFGIPWRLGDVEPLVPDRVTEAAGRLEALGLEVRIGG